MLLKWIGLILLSSLAGALGAVLLLLNIGVLRGPATNDSKIIDVSYADFLAVSLTSVTVVLAALAIGVAVIAMRTIGEIKNDARQTVAREAKTSVESGLPTEVSVCLEQMLISGKLDEYFERTSVRWRSLNPTANRELQPDFDPNEEGER